MQRITCANNCNHGCYVEVADNEHWLPVILAEGWVAHLWYTPAGYGRAGHEHEQSEHGDDMHTMAFCDAMCAFEALRNQLLRQADYAERVVALERRYPADKRAAAIASLGLGIEPAGPDAEF